MKILIVGTGGVGGFYGGLLAKHGHDVTFLARGEHAQAMQSHGLCIKSVVGNFEIKPAKVISDLRQAEIFELILFCVKTYHTDEIGKTLLSAAGKNTVIVSLQNGIDSDQVIKNHLPQSIVIPGIAYIVSARTSPGLIEQTAGPRTIIFGSRNGEHKSILDNIEKIMRDADIEARHTNEIEKELWLKFLWIIAFAGMTSLCRSSIGPIVSDPNTMDIYRRCLQEAFLLAKKLNINVEAKEFETIMRKSEDYKHTDSSAKSSMLVDIENKRPTEIESLHGTLCRLAKANDMPVPVNEIIYYTVRLASKCN